MEEKKKKPYQKPALINIGKYQVDKEAFEKGDLGEAKEEIMRKIREKKEELEKPQDTDSGG
jgi:hypothetical protein